MRKLLIRSFENTYMCYSFLEIVLFWIKDPSLLVIMLDRCALARIQYSNIIFFFSSYLLVLFLWIWSLFYTLCLPRRYLCSLRICMFFPFLCVTTSVVISQDVGIIFYSHISFTNCCIFWNISSII